MSEEKKDTPVSTEKKDTEVSEEKKDTEVSEEKELDLEGRFEPVEGEAKVPLGFKVAQAASKNFNPPPEQPIDLIKDRMHKSGQLPGSRKEPVFIGEDGKPIFNDEEKKEKMDKKELPKLKSEISTFDIDGFKIPLSGIPQLDALTCFMYIMGRHLSQKDPEIKRILNEFQFNFPDATGKQIFPIPEEPKKKNDKPQ